MIKRVLPLAGIALAAAALSLAAVQLVPARTLAPPPEPRPEQPTDREVATDYSRALARLEQRLHAAERSSERYPGQWLRIERVAGFYLSRARLTGDHEDYLRAQRILDEAFAVAPEGSGPLMTRAYLNFTLHRIAAVEPDLAQLERRVIVPASLRAGILGLRGDVAFHAGRFEDAEGMHREAEATRPGSASAFRIAYDLWQTGRFDQAERWLGVAESRIVGPDTGKERAFMALQRGLMDLDRGRYDEALGHYRRADRLFHGYWLVEEHIAELSALRGDTDEAERRYRELVARTNDPEFMDALGEVLEGRGAHDEARDWHRRAEALYERDLERLPEASYGHALAHFLQHGAADRALSLAEANYRLRPGGEAQLRLAQALARSGRLDDARARIEALLATPYRNAAVHATASKIDAARGDTAGASEQARLARELRPDAMEQLDWLHVGR